MTRKSQFISRVSWPPGILRAAARSKIQPPAGGSRETGQPASRSFYGIIFSIPTASTVVAYNISRHINIPEGRRAARWLVQSAGERTTRTTCAAATSAQWRSVLVSGTPR